MTTQPRQRLGITKDRLQTSYNANKKKCVGCTVLWLMVGFGGTGIGIWGVPKLLSGSNMISSNGNSSMPTTLGVPFLVNITGNSSDSMPTTLEPLLSSTTGISPAQLDELERIVKPALDAPPSNNDSAIYPLSPGTVSITELPSSSFMPTIVSLPPLADMFLAVNRLDFKTRLCRQLKIS